MKKMVKALSLFLVLVFVLSMTVVVNADKKYIKPSIYGGVEQTDIYRRTVTINVSDLEDVNKIIITPHYSEKEKGTVKEEVIDKVRSSAGNITRTYSFDVYTNTAKYIKFYEVKCMHDSTVLATKSFYVGENTYFDIDAYYAKTHPELGSYDGIITPNQSSAYTAAPSGNVIEATPYDPNKTAASESRTVTIVGLYTVKCSKLNVRAGMSTKTAKVGSLKKHTNVVVYAIDEGWAKIIYDGQYAYVSAKYLKIV